MCQSCATLTINGLPCHETGCPDAWRDQTRECFECGCDFEPESRHERLCPGCANPEPFEDDEEEAEEACEACGEAMDRDCNGLPRCPDCDGPCPCCYDGGGPWADDEEDDDEA
jgi:hypothetical protein